MLLHYSRSLDLNRRDSWKRVINGRMSSQVWLGQVDDDDTTSASRCSEQRDSDGEEEDDGEDSDSDSSEGENSGTETAANKVVIEILFIETNYYLVSNISIWYRIEILRNLIHLPNYLY
jgi:hypothetical protein